jgi:hypothetical protein
MEGGEWSASRSSRFTLRERVLGFFRIEGWVVPGAGVEAVAKRKIPDDNRTLVVKLAAGHYTD